MPEPSTSESPIPASTHSKEPTITAVEPDTQSDQETQNPKSRVKQLLGRIRNPFRPFPDKPDSVRRGLLIGGGAALGIAALDRATGGLTRFFTPSEMKGKLSGIREYDPSDNDKDEVNKLVDEAIRRASAKNSIDISPEEHIELANKYGLKVYNRSNCGEMYSKLENDQYMENGEYSVKDYFNFAHELLAKFGVELSWGENPTYPRDGKPLQQDDLDLKAPEIKSSILNIVESFFDQPVELIKYTGLQKVCLIKIDQIVERGGFPYKIGGYTLGGYDDTYFIDPTNSLASQDFDHELYHLYDWHKSGRSSEKFDNDTEFSKLNPPEWFYSKDLVAPEQRGGYITNEDYMAFMGKLITEERMRGSTKSFETEIAPLLAEKAKMVVAASHYGTTNPVEEKADFGKILLNPSLYFTALDPRKPWLREKFIFLLARFYSDNQNLVKYLLEVCNPTPDEKTLYHTPLTGAGPPPS